MRGEQTKMNLIKIGLKIAYYRKLRGMTPEELAESCNLPAGYVSQLEGANCFFCPPAKTLFTIPRILEVPAQAYRYR